MLLQLRQAHRRLARHDDQRPPLLQHHVGGALDQVARQPVRDAGQRLHRARHDRHAAAAMAAARDRRAEIAVAVHARSSRRRRRAPYLVGEVRHQALDRRLVAELVAQQPPAVVGDDELDVARRARAAPPASGWRRARRWRR